MPLSYATFTGNSGSPQHTFTIPYNYILKDHIKVYYGRDILANTQTALLVSGTDYNFTSDTTIQLIGSTLNSGTTTGNPHNLANGVVLTLERDTPDSSQIVEFADGSNLIGDNLNNANLQNLFVVQEQQDKNDLSAAKAISSENASNAATNNVATLTTSQFNKDGSVPMTGDINANNNKIKNLADPTNAQDGVTKAYLERTGSITSTQIEDGTIVDGDINASANIAGSKLQAASGSNPGSMSSTDKTKLDTIETSAKDDQTGAEIKSLYEGENNTNAFTDAEKSKLQNIESNAKDDQTGAEIKGLYEGENNTNAFTDAEQTKLSNLDLTKLQNIEVNATQDQTAGEIKTLYESNNNTNPLTDAEKAVIDGVTANTSELNKLDGFTGDVNDLNQISGMSKQETLSNTQSGFPTSAAVVDFVASQIQPLGGLEVVANELSFPNSQPSSGVVISISDAGGVEFNSSGVSTTCRTVGGTTVTIENAPSSLFGETLAAGVGLLVSSTGSSQTYNYHKILGKEDDIKQLSDDINDFNSRYRVLNTLPSNSDSSNHDGDLVYAKDVGKIYVYSGDYNGTPVGTFGEVQSIGNFHISTLSPAFDNTTTAFTITNAPSSVAQILLSLNGIIQEPGTAFTLSGNTVTFASPPPSGSTYFAVVLGSTVNIGTPSNNTITSAMIIDGSIVNADISNSAAIAMSKLALSITNAEINASAAIQGTKISPNFGSQNILTTGKLGIGTTSLNSVFPITVQAEYPGIQFLDAQGTDSFGINADGGVLKLQIGVAGSGPTQILQIETASTTITNNLNANSGLDVSGNITGTGDIILSAAGAERLNMFHAGGGQFVIKNPSAAALSFGTNNQNNELVIANGGNVGIGTSSPSRKLHVSGDALAASFMLASNSSPSSSIEAQIYKPTSNTLAFATNGANERLRINSDGRVMVNGTYGAAQFNVTGETALGLDAKRQFLGINSDNDDMQIRATYYSGGAAGGAYPDIKFVTHDSERLRITAGGNIGINTTSPDRLLHINDVNNAGVVTLLRLTNAAGSAGTEVRMEFECGLDEIAYIGAKHEGSDTGPLIFATASSQNAYPTEKMRILAGGGITFNGDTATDNALDDYEEGTFTFSFPGGISITNNEMAYTKIGRFVFCSGRITFASGSGSNAIINMEGLPFTPNNNLSNSGMGGVVPEHTRSTDGPFFMAVESSSNKVRIRNGASQNQTIANMSGETIRFQLTYMAA